MYIIYNIKTQDNKKYYKTLSMGGSCFRVRLAVDLSRHTDNLYNIKTIIFCIDYYSTRHAMHHRVLFFFNSILIPYE